MPQKGVAISNIPNMPLEDWIPDTLPSVQQVPMLQTKRGAGWDSGVYGEYTPPDGSIGNRFGINKGPFIQVLGGKYISPSPEFDPDATAAHEAGHAIWFSEDMAKPLQDAWESIHDRHIVDAALKSKKSDGSLDKILLRNTVPKFVGRYIDDPSHSFAEAFSQYVTNPEMLQTQSPQAYQFLKNLTGFEYARRSQSSSGKSRSPQSGK